MREGSNREERTAVIHYSEIGIKGKNRPFFTGVLKRNLLKALAGFPHGLLRSQSGRLLLSIPEPLSEAQEEDLVARLRPVIGIAHYAVARRVRGWSLQRLTAHVVALARTRVAAEPRPETFSIEAARNDKSYPLSSLELNRHLGEAVRLATGLSVHLGRPDLKIHVEVLTGGFLVHARRHPGQRGLPVGSSGRVVSLLSSGIDSPVASRRIMGRGCRVYFAHFHSLPYTQRASVDIAEELVEKLAPYQTSSFLYLIPLAEIQQRIVTSAPSPLRVLLYRRYMLRLAERVAQKVKARALVTGESLAQVASQTLENLAAIEEAVNIPVLRPLIGMDKEEIIGEARRLGTYEISIQPYEDCCSFLMPQHPETRAKIAEVREAEAMLGEMEPLIRETLRRTEERRIG